LAPRRVRDQVRRLWLAWTDEADADGLTDFYGLQAMVAREMFVAGECFVRLRPRRAEDGLLVPLQLQMLQSEMLPFEKTEDLGDGRRIRCAARGLGLARAAVSPDHRRRAAGELLEPARRTRRVPPPGRAAAARGPSAAGPSRGRPPLGRVTFAAPFDSMSSIRT
jgi:hypothetical protein